MNDQTKGHCKHGEFILTEGCPECIAEQSAGNAPPSQASETTAAHVTQEAQLLPALITLRDLGQVVEPGLLQIAREAVRLRDCAVARIISNNEDLQPATDDLSIIAKAKKAIIEKKAEILAPFKSKVDIIHTAFVDLLAPLEEADRITRDKVIEFRKIEQEKLALAQREAASKGGEFTTELQEPVPDHTRTGLGTQGFQKVYKWEVTDFAQVPDQYKVINAGMLTGVVKGSKGKITIPGIRVYEDETVRINTR